MRSKPMTAARRTWVLALATAAVMPVAAHADEVKYEVVDGIQWQVTKRNVQVPITEVRDQVQTVYRQQLTTDTVQHQQLYSVPVTQYQLVSRMHGRWNPFMTPYWTHHYEPVTTWTQQMATVQIPITRVAWAPETRTVQAPTTTYRMVVNESRIALGPAPAGAASQPMMASTGPSATLAARPAAPAASAPIGSAPLVAAAPTVTPYGGTALTSDPPRQATGGWRSPSTASTATATAAAPTTTAPSRY
jgi:hypothetical protein